MHNQGVPTGLKASELSSRSTKHAAMEGCTTQLPLRAGQGQLQIRSAPLMVSAVVGVLRLNHAHVLIHVDGCHDLARVLR